jgi:hypothetical protein
MGGDASARRMTSCTACNVHPAVWECVCVLPGETTIQRPGFGLVPADRTPGVPGGRPTLAVRVALTGCFNHERIALAKRAFAQRT